jgi:hypothetical protein
VPSRHCAIAFALLRAWRQAPGWMSRRRSPGSVRVLRPPSTKLGLRLTGASEAHGDGAGANATFRPAEPRTNPQLPSRKGT